MHMNKNYYDILGVPKSASEAEIKKAYKKMAMQYHPDRNKWDKKAEEKFKEINEAYQILSDSTKKEITINLVQVMEIHFQTCEVEEIPIREGHNLLLGDHFEDLKTYLANFETQVEVRVDDSTLISEISSLEWVGDGLDNQSTKNLMNMII